MNNWALTVSNPLSLDRTGECRWIAHLRWQAEEQNIRWKNKTKRKWFVWYEWVKTWMSTNIQTAEPSERFDRPKFAFRHEVTKKAWIWIGMLKSLWFRFILCCHYILWSSCGGRELSRRAMSVIFFLLASIWPHLDWISWPNPTWAGLWSSASGVSATSSGGVTLD